MKPRGRETTNTAPKSMALAAMLLALLLAPVAPAAEQLTRVQFWSMGTSTRISVEFSGEFKFKAGKIAGPDRVFFDLPNTSFSLEGKTKGLYLLPVNDKLVKQVRVANQAGLNTRLVVDLETDAEYTVAQVKSPHRLIIEISPLGPSTAPPPETPSVTATYGTAAGPSAPVTASMPAPAPTITASTAVTKNPPKRFEPPVIERKSHIPADPPQTFDAPPQVALRVASLPRTVSAGLPRGAAPPRSNSNNGSAAIPASAERSATMVATPAAGGDRSLTRALGLKLNRVMIDAGHGGHDEGSKGRNGLKEKDLVLDLALRVGKLVEERLGAEVIYTRETDVFIPLEERPQIANDRHADLFLSIHGNSSAIASATGVETYYLSVSSSKQALEVAARENAASTQSIADLENLLQKIALNEKIKESVEFASRMQTALANGTGAAGKAARNRGVRKAPFIVLIGAKMPAILAEVGFISNPQEEDAMRTSEYRDKLAEAILKGIESYGQSLSRFQLAARPPVKAVPGPDPAPVSSNSSTPAAKRTVAARTRRAGASN